MSDIDPKHRQQVERWLGRPLTEQELRPAESLETLTDEQLEVVAAIRPNNIIAPALYLNFVVPSASMVALTPFIDNIADILAARKSQLHEVPDWPNLPLFERYAGRPLSAAEKQSVSSLDELAPEHRAMAATLARQERTVAFLYLCRVVPSATAEARDALVAQLLSG